MYDPKQWYRYEVSHVIGQLYFKVLGAVGPRYQDFQMFRVEYQDGSIGDVAGYEIEESTPVTKLEVLVRSGQQVV